MADGLLLKTAFGSADVSTRTTPFFAYREVLLYLLDLKEKITNFGEKGASDIIKDKLQLYKLQEYASLLNDFLPFNFPENELTTSMNPQVRSESIQEILLKIIRSQAEMHPIVIILDDVQWLDAASWSLTAAICRQIEDAVVVLSTRPVDRLLGSGDYAMIKNLSTTQLLRVGLLSKPEITQLVCEQLAVDRLPRVIEDVIKDKAQGLHQA